MENLNLCFISSDRGGCGHYRSYLPYKYLCKDFNTFYDTGFNPEYVNDYMKYDVVIFQRHCHPAFLKFIDKMHDQGKQIWFDIDDLLWQIPKTNISYKNWTKTHIDNLSKLMSKCDAVTTSTVPLQQYLRKYHKNVYISRNMIEDDFVEKKQNKKVRILYAGSITHTGDFESGIIHAIDYILRKHDIEFYFMGYIPKQFNTTIYGDKVRFIEGVQIEAYIKALHIINPDISIMPLADNYFNSCKSNLKFLESTLAGGVSIASKIYPYENTIDDGYDGFICNKSKEWIFTIEDLIYDTDYRLKIFNNAVDKVKNNFMWNDINTQEISDLYKEIYNRAS